MSTQQDAELEALTQPRESRGNQGIPLVKWRRLIDVFRAQGSSINYREASRHADVKPSTAKENFEKGAERLKRPAIRDILLQEQVAARAQVEKTTTHIEERLEALGGDIHTRQSANKNAVSTRAAEGRLVAGSRATAEICLAAAGKLLRAAGPLTEALSRELLKDINSPSTNSSQLGSLFGRLLDYSREAVALARAASELERLHLGAPEKTIAFTAEVSTAEAAQEIAALLRMMARVDEVIDPVLADELKRAGVNLRVLPGGKAATG